MWYNDILTHIILKKKKEKKRKKEKEKKDTQRITLIFLTVLFQVSNNSLDNIKLTLH